MSRLNDLLRELHNKAPALAADLEREVAALADRRAFGLNFERHVPEAVELPGRRVRRGHKVRILPPRGKAPKKTDQKLWRVTALTRADNETMASLTSMEDDETTRRLDPAKPGDMSQVSGGEVELVDVGGDCLVESVEVAA